MTAEQKIAEQLQLRVGSLVPGARHRMVLEQVVLDGVGRWQRGPHPIGWVERMSDGLMLKLANTAATRTAAALLEDDLLDVALSDSYPPVIRLVADVGSVGAAEGPGQGRREAGPQGSGQGRT